jgi:cytochrome c oxidase accessory protein FixG
MSQVLNDAPEEEFRDKIATVDSSGKRIWIFPKKPSGKFTNYRKWLSVLLLAVLFGLPLIDVHGEPFVLFNIIERNFILFGMHFGPQDFYLFAIAMLIFIVFIILFTVVFGRLFCGWICPQTIFMEMVYRNIEYWIEGDFTAQRKLDAAPWTFNKVLKKGSKQFLFFVIAVLISNTFLSYIIGFDQVVRIITEPVSAHLTGFIAMIIFSFAFYLVFARLREQVCTTICPYGRLQGVMLDNKSLVVAYDFVRGEPRGKIKKDRTSSLALSADSDIRLLSRENEQEAAIFQKSLGDCVDCKLCVHVCPTGIDIRNGTQLECVNCTACMDACDDVMEKVHRPKGLIRIDSIEGIEKGKRNILNPRTYAYSAVLLVLIFVEVLLFTLRSDVEVLLLRTGGLLAQKQADGTVSNLYNYQLINKTSESLSLEFKMLDPVEGSFEIVGGKQPAVQKNDKSEGALFIRIPGDKLESGKNKIVVGVYADGNLITKVKTTFFSPVR